jgi:hypothetical protein
MIAEKPAVRRVLRGHFLARAGNNARFAVRRLFAACVLLTVTVGPAADLCRGWSASAADRASCCERMQNHCASWSSPDDCCEKGEQRRSSDLARALPLPAADMTPGPLVSPLPFVGNDGRFQALADRPRTHLLHTVFLI